MDRFLWIIEEVLKQFKTIEEYIRAMMAKLPGVGAAAADHSNLITLGIVAIITVFVIKPLVKWSLGIVAIGTALAAVISYFTGMTFWGVLPITALCASIVMFSNKFTMG
jgi:hypothetical protein